MQISKCTQVDEIGSLGRYETQFILFHVWVQIETLQFQGGNTQPWRWQFISLMKCRVSYKKNMLRLKKPDFHLRGF